MAETEKPAPYVDVIQDALNLLEAFFKEERPADTIEYHKLIILRGISELTQSSDTEALIMVGQALAEVQGTVLRAILNRSQANLDYYTNNIERIKELMSEI